MEFKPHDYQQYAIEYIETHEIAAILLDMGLGKTAITLTALYDLLFDYFEITRVLVIAPLRVARNTWPQEIEKWDHLKDVRYSVAVGTEKERLEAFRRDADITSSTGRTSNGWWRMSPLNLTPSWWTSFRPSKTGTASGSNR